jgi:hypothetical protein
MTHLKPTVRIIRVFVSSPGDVQNEREVLSSVVDGINTTDGQYRGFRLELFRWEKNTAPLDWPESRKRPWTLRRLPTTSTSESCRCGSATPTDTADSGTEEEFNAALDKWQALGEPWIMFYFNDAPNPKEVRRQLAQYTKVCEFRETLEKQGLVAGYEEVEGGDSAFRTKVDLHLRNVVHSIFPMRPAGPLDSSQPTRVEVPSQYLPWLQSECAGIDLLGMRLKEGQSLRLTQVYVPLITLRTGR